MYKIKKQIKVMTLAVLCLAGVLMCNVTVQAASADNSLSSLTLSEGTFNIMWSIIKHQWEAARTVSRYRRKPQTKRRLFSRVPERMI